ncbi:MAG: hypothetical protein PSN34_05155 [Urechidicola sp.]|nr:hypothetical protein [Urechidicola sp.]
MKKLFFTIAVCLLTTLSFAKDEKASENVESIEAVECMTIYVICGDGHRWEYSGCLAESSFDAMIDQLISGCQ